MKESLHRKSPRFFVINPVNDRRSETRFESEEPIRVQNLKTRQFLSGRAFDIGHFGLRLEVPASFEVGDHLQIEFIRRHENIGCWGQVAWCEAKGSGSTIQSGIAIESWYGIIDGPESWRQVKGVTLKKDRRQKLR